MGLFDDKEILAIRDKYEKLTQEKKFDEVLQLIEEHFDDRNPVTWMGKGLNLTNLERYDEAITAFKMSLKIQNNFIDTLYLQGLSLHGARRYRDAVESFLKIIQLEKEENSWSLVPEPFSLPSCMRIILVVKEAIKDNDKDNISQDDLDYLRKMANNAYERLSMGVIPKFPTLDETFAYCEKNKKEILERLEPPSYKII